MAVRFAGARHSGEAVAAAPVEGVVTDQLRLHPPVPAPRSAAPAPDPVIRRIYDPAAVPGAANDALVYLEQHAPVLVPQFANAMTVIRTTAVTVPQAIARAIENSGATVAARVNAAKRMLNRAASNVPLSRTETAADITVAVRALNYLERELNTTGALSTTVQTIKIGTEFSFGDRLPRSNEEASINIRLAAEAEPKNEDQEAKKTRLAAFEKPRTRARDRIIAWTDSLAAIPISGSPTLRVQPHKGKADFAKKIEYTFDKPTPWTWYWVADIDEGCYETQTMPTSIGDLGSQSVREIIEKHIFGAAAAVKLKKDEPLGKKQKKGSEKGGSVPTTSGPVGLHPDESSGGGGGHISFDVGTSFADTHGSTSLELLLTTLAHLQSDADILAKGFRRDKQSKPLMQKREDGRGDEQVPLDTTNAPSLANQELKGSTENPLDEYLTEVQSIKASVLTGGADTIESIQKKLVTFNQRLTNPQIAEGERKQHVEDPQNISHYQAINIEHLADEKTDSRRIEIRDVPAQTGYDKLLRDLDVLKKALEKARDEVRSAQVKRLS